MVNNNEWLQSLKPGDKVVECVYYQASQNLQKEVRTVTKVTATLICIGKDRYRKENGGLLGGNVYSEYLSPWSQSEEDAIKEYQLKLRRAVVVRDWFEKHRHDTKTLAMAYQAIAGAGLIKEV